MRYFFIGFLLAILLFLDAFPNFVLKSSQHFLSFCVGFGIIFLIFNYINKKMEKEIVKKIIAYSFLILFLFFLNFFGSQSSRGFSIDEGEFWFIILLGILAILKDIIILIRK